MDINRELMDKIRDALARGYCTNKNKDKVLDIDLIEDMVYEIGLILVNHND